MVQVRSGSKFQIFDGPGPVLDFWFWVVLVRSETNRFWSVDPWLQMKLYFAVKDLMFKIIKTKLNILFNLED